MATEGTFPKVDGDVLYASEVNNYVQGSGLGIIFKNLSEHIAGGTSWLKSVFVSTPSEDSRSEITTPYYPHNTLISGPTAFWVPSAGGTGYGPIVTLPANQGNIYASGAGNINLNGSNVRLDVTFVGNGASDQVSWYITDGGTDVYIANSIDNSTTYSIKVWPGSANSTSYNGVGDVPTGTLNIANRWGLKFVSTGNRGITTSKMVYWLGSPNLTQSFIGQLANVPGSVIKDAILCTNLTQAAYETGSIYISANSGTNWEDVSNKLNQRHNFTYPGSHLCIKATLTNSGCSTGPTLNRYSCMYDCGFNS